MLNKLLLPHHWKLVGLALTLLSLPAGFYMLFTDTYEWWPVTLPAFVEKIFWVDYAVIGNSTKVKVLYLFDEAVVVTLLAGLALLGFSREKVEDEWIEKIRLESLQWAILLNTALLALFTIFVHGFPFFTVMTVNMFTPLLIFVARFHYILYLKPRLIRQPA